MTLITNLLDTHIAKLEYIEKQLMREYESLFAESTEKFTQLIELRVDLREARDAKSNNK